MTMDDFTEPPDFVRSKKCGLNLLPNEASSLAARIEQCAHGAISLFEIVDIGWPWLWLSVITVVQPQNQQSVSQNGLW